MVRPIEFEEDDWGDEAPDAEDLCDGDDSPDELLECPSCRGGVHEDTQQCPHCGDWITPVDARGGWKQWVWIAAAVLLVLVMSGVLLL